MDKEVVISPIFYMGNKRKLVQKGLTNFFPSQIDHYYEPFAGSAIVAMNTPAKRYYINDIDSHLLELYDLFRTNKAEEIIEAVNSRIDLYGLPRERTKRNVFHDKEKIEQYKAAYCKLRDRYNNEPTGIDLYTLTLFSFSQQFRFNSKGKYNMPFGNDCFSEKNEQYIYNGCEFFGKDNVQFENCSFDVFFFDSDILSQTNTFVYLDPPYLNTTAVYNESRGSDYTWSEKWEQKLRDLCNQFTKYDVRFAMSNVFANKDFINTSLQKWCEDNNYRVHHFNHAYTACGKGNAATDEVLIMNYGGVD